ncbi:MAG: NERD domain-containing protein [Oscillospiraceae bacterium]|nr:NERD domain-containing protein [Oscillospiraceae bacterium]
MVNNTQTFETPAQVGKYGEDLLHQELLFNLQSLPGEKYILRNLLIPTNGDVHTTQIDMIFFHSSGIYVFECKYWAGVVYINSAEGDWRQTFSDKSKNKSYTSPVKQNKMHIKWLKKFLAEKGLTGLPIHSIVAYGGSCELKNLERIKNYPVTICRIENVPQEVMKIAKKKQPLHKRVCQALYPFSSYVLTEKDNEEHDERCKTYSNTPQTPSIAFVPPPSVTFDAFWREFSEGFVVS